MKHLTSKFILYTFLFSWVVHVPFAMRAQKIIDFTLPSFIIWVVGIVPALVAFILIKSDEERLKSLKSSIVKVKVPLVTLCLCFFLPSICLLVAYSADSHINLFTSPEIVIYGIVWIILAYGEEIGWRGLALPELAARFNPFIAASIVGLFWCIWHYPKGLSNYYIKDWSVALQGLGMFSIQIIMANYILAWLYFKSKRSIFITSLFHGLFNVTATIYSFMAIDGYVTSVLALTALILILIDRKMFFTRQEHAF